MVRKIVVRLFIGIVLVLLYLPIVWMIVFSFSDTPSFSNWNGFTFQNYIDLFTGQSSNASRIQEAVVNTLFVGACTSLLSTLLGTLGAIGLHAIHNKRIKAVYSTSNQIPMINSEIVTAIALALLFNLIATVIPISEGTWIETAIKLILYEAALDLGCTPAKAMWKVVIPDILPGIVVGALLAFTLSIDDFVITKVNVTSFETLSTMLYGLKSGKHPLPADIKSLFSIIFFIVFAAIMIMYSPKRQAKQNK